MASSPLASPPSVVTSPATDCRFMQLPPETLQLVADFFKVLSESSRLQIMCALKVGPQNVSEIIEATGLGQANVSKHLKILAQAGVVRRQQQGVCVYYQIANAFVFDLCELVCDSLSMQVQQQSEKIAGLEAFRQPLP
ncbi:metalloregulator ArsR/SmtB family transcription factor [Leptolyngbya sp. BL0902]|uniref:ArsR/SmtB family transcription factor n=1 Tax=Leptolyngbya sp. BL0902 TaxID=1115757 RepID=UPI0029392928|nr:metalloregulator ArsR/SmtB family transcription factor [Leptolyngbya sp. BL0902]